MSEHGLTREERRCLQLWFRQALAQVERDELSSQLITRDCPPADKTGEHRSQVSRRRARHSPVSTHGKQLALR